MRNRLTDLQFVVVEALLDGAKSGREIRAYLATKGFKKSGPAFYQLMARLEDAGFISGKYDERVVNGQRLKERNYKMLATGKTAYRETSEFYSPSPLFGALGNA